MQTRPRTTAWLFGSCLGVAIALAIAATASPVTADDRLGNGMKCERDSECKSSDCYHNACRGRSDDKIDNGGKCERDSDCKSRDCYHDSCRGRSDDKIDNGGKCERDSDCKSRDCYHEACRGR